MLRKNKKGQIGTTVTWLVATISIFIILVLLIYSSSLLSKIKSVDADEVETGESSESLILKKSMFAFLLSENSYDKLSADKEFRKPTEDLALRVFSNIYASEFFIRIGIDDDLVYLGSEPSALEKNLHEISGEIKLKNRNKFSVILNKKLNPEKNE